ncbi:MAG: lipopolysaccharide biosynthesis protein [Haliea sp.]|nr:lipopolysaccharide biosynthesis protein [Haliea sp.]
MGLFLKRSAVVALIRVTGLVSVFALQILLARLIGDTGEYGKYAWGQSLMFMAGTIAAMGIPIATSRFVASLSARHDEFMVANVVIRARKILSRSAVVLISLSLGIFVASSYVVANNSYLDLSVVALLLAPGVSLLLLYQHLCRARQWLILAFLPLQVVRPMFTALLATALWWIGGLYLSGMMTLFLVGLSVIFVLIGQMTIFHRRQDQLLAVATEPRRQSLEFRPEQLLPTARPIFLARIGSLTIEYSNVLLVGFLAGPATAGAYFAAERLAQLSSIPVSIVSSVNQPEMAAAVARGHRKLLHDLTRQAAHTGLWPTLVITLTLAIFAGSLLSLFGHEFASASPVLIILVFGVLAKTAAGPVDDLVLMTGNQHFLPRVMMFTALLHLLGLSLLVPALGAVGAAITSAFSGLLSAIWLMRFVRRELAINPTILAGSADQ